MRFQVLVGERDRVQLNSFSAELLISAPSATGAPRRRFARLACKRHRHYLRSIPTVASVAAFHALVAADEQAEVALLLVVRGTWFGRSPVLGLAQCRRTYCHHLVLEFLSVHPAIDYRVKL